MTAPRSTGLRVRCCALLGALLHAACAGSAGTPRPDAGPRADAGAPWQSLFNGRDLEGWERFLGQTGNVGILAGVGGNEAGVDALGFQLGHCGLKLICFAGAEQHPGTKFTQRLGHLQPQAA